VEKYLNFFLRESAMKAKSLPGARIILSVCFVLGVLVVIGVRSSECQEAKFPAKPIEVIVPYGPGGFIDVANRIVVEYLAKEFKVPVVVKNQPGASGLVGCTTFLKSKPDGHAIISVSGGAVINAILLSKSPPFDPLKELLPAAYMAGTPIAMSVSKDSPFKSFEDFRQFGRKNPGKLRGGVTSPGSDGDVMFRVILRDAEIDAKRVPYVGTGEVVPALLGKHLDYMVLSLSATMPYIRSGDMRVLLLTRRSPEFPKVPSGPEVGLPRFSINYWFGYFLLPQTPKAVYEKWVSVLETVSKNSEMVEKLKKNELMVDYKNPTEFTSLIKGNWRITSQIIQETGMKLE
jgi:tripartite-type tricarboxylate transporter receptor subunit TctC